MVNERDEIQADPKSESSEFKAFNGTNISKSKGRTVALILLNTNPENGNFSEESKAKEYHSKYSGGEEFNDYDNAETIFHEIKAHVDLSGSKDQHGAYGSKTYGLMRDDIVPIKGSPADKIKKQLLQVFKKDNSKVKTPIKK